MSISFSPLSVSFGSLKVGVRESFIFLMIPSQLLIGTLTNHESLKQICKQEACYAILYLCVCVCIRTYRLMLTQWNQSLFCETISLYSLNPGKITRLAALSIILCHRRFVILGEGSNWAVKQHVSTVCGHRGKQCYRTVNPVFTLTLHILALWKCQIKQMTLFN